MTNHSLDLLKTLTETPGVFGFESPVRKVLADLLSPYASELKTDKLGSLIAVKNGAGRGSKIMLAAHMVEIGFMITYITDEGFIKFQTLGGWWEQVLLAQRVEILTSRGSVTGVIGAKAPHILPEEERKKPVKLKAMFIDVGSTSRDETEKIGIRPGDPIIPFSLSPCQGTLEQLWPRLSMTAPGAPWW